MDSIFQNWLTGKQKALGWAILVPGYFFSNAIIANFLIYSFYKLFPSLLSSASYSLLNVTLNILYGLISLIMIFFILKDFIKREWQIFKKEKATTKVLTIVLGYALTFCTTIISSIIIRLLVGGSSSVNQQNVESLLQAFFLLMAIQAVVIAPIVEEAVFRGVIFRSIRIKSKFWAHFISAFLFGFVHIYRGLFAGDITQLAYIILYGGMGLVFSIVYEKKGTIIYPIIIHMVNNLIAVMITFAK